MSAESTPDTVIIEMVDPDGQFHYDEINHEEAEEHGLLSERVDSEKEAELREEHDGDGHIHQPAFPDRDEPLGEPYEMVRDEETGEWTAEYGAES